MVSTTSSFLLLLFVSSSLFVTEAQIPAPVKGLSWKFYETSFPQLESIIRKRLEKQIKDDVGQAAGLLRLHFHDCFVQPPKNTRQ
ncbi:peroxidase 12 [Nicotiana attenuata]|uniref:peroxidase n=1 Tax=Nicotiana attenuata TaxID=49451 RepID=A0A1J6JBL4_NICAT|nr:peroxidase 12 [Nicotiana attenuata]